MPLFRDTSHWRIAGTDIAYKDPFSESTHRIRRKLIFVAFVVVLNHYFPIDLQHSHVLGIAFGEAQVPSLSGILVILVFFFLIEFSIYTYQEFMAWLAQGKEMMFCDYLDRLEALDDSNKDFSKTLDQVAKESKRFGDALEKFPVSSGSPQRSDDPEALKRFRVGYKRLISWIDHVDESATNYESEISEARKMLQTAKADHSRVFWVQMARVGLVEIAFPLSLAVWAIIVAIDAMFLTYESI